MSKQSDIPMSMQCVRDSLQNVQLNPLTIQEHKLKINRNVPCTSSSASVKINAIQHDQPKVKKTRRRERKKKKEPNVTTLTATPLTIANVIVPLNPIDEPPIPFEDICSYVSYKPLGFYLKRRTFLPYIKLKSYIRQTGTSIFVTDIRSLLRLPSIPMTRLKNANVVRSKSSLTKNVKIHFVLEPEAVSCSSPRKLNDSFHSPSTSKNLTYVANPKSSDLKNTNDLSTPPKSPKKKNKPTPKKSPKTLTPNEKFEDYISFEELEKELEDGTLIRGDIRINPKDSRQSYVSNGDSALPDYYIMSIVDRNRALEGDHVVLRLKPESQWSYGKPTANVVYIESKIHPRITVGTLRPLEGNKKEYATFYSRDKRIPRLRILPTSWPQNFKNMSKQYENVLFVAKIVEWSEPGYAIGVIIEKLGNIGDLKVETAAILKEFGLDTAPFPPSIMDDLAKIKTIPETELKYRRDIRKDCVFTIDPLTARDLDDAVSVNELENGNYEVGVHISDAAFYLELETELDKIVSKKATTIYLVDNVYHMLPVELCLHCSLLPGEDKLAFSVFWEINKDGEILDTQFTRTILNSCTQLAYEHAQRMIEHPEKNIDTDELPKINNGYTGKDLSRTVNILQNIAANLREKRIKNGALRIDQVKLLFNLHPTTGEPLDFRIYENKEAHRLIEEFMLLANISVAQKIYESFPELAFLRCHDPPKTTMMKELRQNLEICGMHIDISSSGAINQTMKKYITDDFPGRCRGAVLNHLLAKPMQRAKYFCSGSSQTEDVFNHFALSVQIYTHFTSPIRRYADIMVHRLLAASLGYIPKPSWNIDYVQKVASNCNLQKYNAKRAGEESSELYLAHYIEKHQPYVQNCVVVDVKDSSFDAIVLNTGSIVRLYQKSCEESCIWLFSPLKPPIEKTENKADSEKKVMKLAVTFPKTLYLPEVTLNIERFTVLKVKLQRRPNENKLEASLLRPIHTEMFENIPV